MTDPRPIRCAECGNVIGHRDNRDAAHALFIEHLASDHPDQLARLIDAYVGDFKRKDDRRYIDRVIGHMTESKIRRLDR